MIVYNYDADLEVSDTCVRSSLLSWVDTVSSLKIEGPRLNTIIYTLHMNNTKYENLCNDWCHSCFGQLHKSHWTPPLVIYTWSRHQSISFSKSTSSRPPVTYFRSQSNSFMWLVSFSSPKCPVTRVVLKFSLWQPDHPKRSSIASVNGTLKQNTFLFLRHSSIIKIK